jgi:hypothetical protein
MGRAVSGRSGPGGEAPAEVRDLAERRAAARQARDFAAADQLRAAIAALGWLVTDSAAGYTLAAARVATVGLLVEGWPGDLRECVSALLAAGQPRPW